MKFVFSFKNHTIVKKIGNFYIKFQLIINFNNKEERLYKFIWYINVKKSKLLKYIQKIICEEIYNLLMFIAIMIEEEKT